jgi:hypothetical protein
MAAGTGTATIDPRAAGTPEWWLASLDRELTARIALVRKFENYYAGKHPLAFATEKFREAFGGLFAELSSNWCELIVDASVERLTIEGFRFSTDKGGDDDAWNIWQANALDVESDMAHTEAGKTGWAYTIVGPNPDDPDTPIITVEHPSQVIVRHAAGNRRKRVAALKKWLADDGHAMATVYLPDAIHRFRSKAKWRGGSSIRWDRRPGAEEPVPNRIGVVPVVEIANKPSMLAGGRSDLASAIPLQNAINKLCSDMIVAAEYAAFRQRWATGVDIPDDPATGKPMDPKKFLSDVARIWAVSDDQAKFGDFGVTELGNYVKAMETLIQQLAAQTRTPPHYLLGQSGAFPSGESLKATETGLVKKIDRKQKAFGEGWEETMRLAFLYRGDRDRGTDMKVNTIWTDPETSSEGELVDALVKMATLGVPQEELWRRWHVPQEQIDRWKTMQTEDAARAGLLDFTGGAGDQGADLTAPAVAVGNGAG